MDALDQLVTQVQALSGSEQDVAHLSTVLKQADELLHTHALRLGYALAALNPAKHSLGYLYLLFVPFPLPHSGRFCQFT
jgi:COP9 signalosome complex subunit 3